MLAGLIGFFLAVAGVSLLFGAAIILYQNYGSCVFGFFIDEDDGDFVMCFGPWQLIICWHEFSEPKKPGAA